MKQKKKKRKLTIRQAVYDKMSDDKGFTRPGSVKKC